MNLFFPGRRGRRPTGRSPVRRNVSRSRLFGVEPLEARRVLATITVDSLADNTTSKFLKETPELSDQQGWIR